MHGAYQDIDPAHDRLFGYTRTLGETRCLVLINFGKESSRLRAAVGSGHRVHAARQRRRGNGCGRCHARVACAPAGDGLPMHLSRARPILRCQMGRGILVINTPVMTQRAHMAHARSRAGPVSERQLLKVRR